MKTNIFFMSHPVTGILKKCLYLHYNLEITNSVEFIIRKIILTNSVKYITFKTIYNIQYILSNPSLKISVCLYHQDFMFRSDNVNKK